MRIGTFKESYVADAALFDSRTQHVWLGIAAALLVAFPFVASDYWLYLACLIAINVASSTGLNILTGYTGLVSLGQAAFMGLGAYTVAILQARWGTPLLLNLLAGGFVAMLGGMVVGIPSLRVKGLYLAIVTIAALFIAHFLFANFSITGGTAGLSMQPGQLFGAVLDTSFRLYWLIVPVTVLMLLGAANLFRTRIGRAFIAIRDRDISAEVLGIPLLQYKLLSFGLSSFYAGVAGGLWAYFFRVVTPESFPLSLSIFFLAAIIVGGMGSILGGVLGAAFMTLAPEVLKADRRSAARRHGSDGVPLARAPGDFWRADHRFSGLRAAGARRNVAPHAPVLPPVALPQLTHPANQETDMAQQRISTRRRSIMLTAAAAGAAALTQPLSVLAQGADEIVIGGSIPMKCVFAFAGVGINAGIQDYVKIVNDAGGIKGRKVKYVPEDTGYKVDVSVAAFKKITSQNKVNLYYGDSTGFAKTINPELDRNGNILMAGASFATELNDPKKYPHQFLVGPDYTEMFGILLKHIAKEKPGAKVAFVYSDSEFGRDPIDSSEALAKKLGLSVPVKIMTPAGSVDVSTEVIKLRRAAPDYTIFHGYILAPIPEFITQGKQQGMTSKWMGTFWTMDSSTVMKMGPDGEGFMGLMPYRYYYDTEKAPMLEKIRAMRPEYQSTAYTQGFLAAMLFLESAKRTLEANKPLTGDNLKAALNSIKDFDTGGLIGVPITISGNSIPVGRVYRADMKAQKMVAASDWIKL